MSAPSSTSAPSLVAVPDAPNFSDAPAGVAVASPTPTITRTYEYEGRPTDVARMLSMPGLDYLRGIISGEQPAAPIAATLGFKPVEVDFGRAVFEGVPARYAYNPLGGVHGGWYATLLDSALGCAIHSTLPAGKGYTTIDLSVSLVRGITERTKLVRCEAKVVHSGSTVSTAEAKLFDDRGQLCAHGTTTCLIMTPR